MNTIARLRAAAYRSRANLLLGVTVAAGIFYGLAVVGGSLSITRFSAFLMAGAITAYLVDENAVPRPKGTAMVSIAAFVLLLEGAAHAITEEIDQASFLEMGIGVYLLISLRMLVRR